MKLINLGCGSQFHPDWINVDIISSSPQVQAHDIRENIPYPTDYFDACYSSHVIEHMSKSEVSNVINECYRVLKPQGIIRVVVPDLESVVKDYLKALERVAAGEKEVESEYDWMTIEVLDQLGRSFSGGEMGAHLSNPNLSDREKDFIKYRIGTEAEKYWVTAPISNQKSLAERFRSIEIPNLINKLKNSFLEFIIFTLGGTKSQQAYKEGLFRNSGEIHRWMYDRFSLQRLLEQSGFINVKICHVDESQIPFFEKYGLDTSEGKVRKPDSLFMEAIKP